MYLKKKTPKAETFSPLEIVVKFQQLCVHVILETNKEPEGAFVLQST